MCLSLSPNPNLHKRQKTAIFFNCKFITALEKHKGVKFGPEILESLCHMESKLK